MDLKTKEACSEISEIFWLLGDNYTEKLPPELIKYIESNKSQEYIPTYSRENSIDELDLKEETKAILAFLYLSYWCDSIEEKNEILEQIKDNDKKNEINTTINTLKLNELFPNKKNTIDENHQIINEQLTIIQNESILKKIFNKIKKFFSKNK